MIGLLVYYISEAEVKNIKMCFTLLRNNINQYKLLQHYKCSFQYNINTSNCVMLSRERTLLSDIASSAKGYVLSVDEIKHDSRGINKLYCHDYRPYSFNRHAMGSYDGLERNDYSLILWCIYFNKNEFMLQNGFTFGKILY